MQKSVKRKKKTKRLYKNRMHFQHPTQLPKHSQVRLRKLFTFLYHVQCECSTCSEWGHKSIGRAGPESTHRQNQILLHVVYPACITCGFSFICLSSPLYNNLHFGVFLIIIIIIFYFFKYLNY